MEQSGEKKFRLGEVKKARRIFLASKIEFYRTF